MRDKALLFALLLGAGGLLYVGRDLLAQSAVVTWGLSFAGTTAAGILGLALYRVQAELRASQRELGRRQAELNFALEVQQALFPREFPADRGMEFAALCVPARGISGDYYDVMRLDDGRVVFAIADISGKGISAAILMSNLHAVLRTLAAAGSSPDEVCQKLNRHLCEVTDGFRFATLFYGEWNCAARCLSYINAGHTIPILLGSGHGRQLDHGGPPLGLFSDCAYQMGKIALESGDMIVLYSDGVTEAENPYGELYGESRLRALIAAHQHKPLAEIQQQVFKEVRTWSSKEVRDDVTLLLAKVTSHPKEAS